MILHDNINKNDTKMNSKNQSVMSHLIINQNTYLNDFAHIKPKHNRITVLCNDNINTQTKSTNCGTFKTLNSHHQNHHHHHHHHHSSGKHRVKMFPLESEKPKIKLRKTITHAKKKEIKVT